MIYRNFNIDPKTEEERKQCEPVAGMRQRIQRYSEEDSLTRSITRAAYHLGLSGEDTMTWLAFEALRRIEHMEQLLLDHKINHVAPMTIIPPT